MWIVILLIALLLLLPGNFFYLQALHRRRHTRHSGGFRPSGGPATFRMDRDWLRATPQQDVFIQSRDGLQLRARLLPQGDCRRFALICHGYRAHSASTAHFARHFYEQLGASLLLPDARAHGESEGRSIGMGWPERLDVLDWIAELNRRYDDPEILLFGVSMGGATAMNAAGEGLPQNVRCIVSDCGYSSLRDELIWQLHTYYHLPARLMLLAAEPFCRLYAGYSLLRDGDGCAQLQHCARPLLLIHGGSDRFVPPQMLDRAYEAAAGPKEKLIVEGAGHAESAFVAPELYWATVDAFWKRYMGA